MTGRGAPAETPAERDEAPISLPAPVDDPPRGAFPWLMMLAPTVLGAGLVVMTGSMHGLLVAVLGPVLALGTVVDQRLQRRARVRRADARFDAELVEATAAVDARLARELARRRAAHPTVADVVAGRAGPLAETPLGVSTVGAAIAVALGTTDVPSGIRLDALGAAADRRTRALAERARVLPDVPLVEPVRRLAVAGTAALAVPCALGLVVDAATTAPRGLVLSVTGAGTSRVRAELVLAGLHVDGAVRLAGPEQSVIDGSEAPVLAIALAATAADAPADAEAVLKVVSRTSAVVRRGGGATRVRPQLVEAAEFRGWAARHRSARRRQGLAGDGDGEELPASCDLATIVATAPPPAARGAGHHLAAPLGEGPLGPVWVDLVADGPHAVVGGTTGTGKSELLRAWISALGARYPATHVGVLCLDFKGGATFDAIAALPHCVGVVTDLDGGEAVRVLAGLRAELRRRERVLRELGARDIAALAPGRLSRLVVVVDEFQALLDEHRDLHDAFADLAARGRSLGIHLVLCAQRPAGAARESLLANCAVRLSLRVTNPADSHAVVGTNAAAALPVAPRGRAVLTTGGPLAAVQLARVGDALVREIADRRGRELAAARARPPDPPWLPPLPWPLPPDEAAARLGDAAGGIVPIALLDDPGRQRQPTLDVDTRGGAHLLVLGPGGSGRTTALRAIAERLADAGVACATLPAHPEAAWDELARVRARTGAAPLVLVIDDLDGRAAAYGDDHRHAFLGMLVDLAGLGGSRRVTIIAAATRASGELGALLGAAREVVRLGSPPRHEFVLSGGEPTHYRPELPPGRGIARGLLAQFPLPRGVAEPDAAPQLDPIQLDMLAAAGGAIVSRRPDERVRQLAAAGVDVLPVPRPGSPGLEQLAGGGPPGIVVGDPEAWQQAYGALARLAARAPVVFDGIGAAALRGLLPGEGLPPPVLDPTATMLVRDGRGYRRAHWPPTALDAPEGERGAS